MPHQEIDISWQVLRRIVHDWAGTAAELRDVKPLVGGCINTTLALTTADGARAVLKISPHRVDRRYEEEAYQLNLLREIGLPAPEVYIAQTGSLDDPFSYLLMEFVDGNDLAQAQRLCSPQQFDHLQMHLAELVLTLHEQHASHYRRVSSDGSPGGEFEEWGRFFHHVYDDIWREVEKTSVLPVKCRKQIGRIHKKLDDLLRHEDRPRLVHWDIWATNLLACPDDHGRWWIVAVLDPNCKYAHAEAEIAYMELFSTITPAFLRAYQQTRKLPPGYHQVRKPIYQLYSLINHVRLFGQDYLKPLMAAVDRASSLA